jgi:hypothetical protein
MKWGALHVLEKPVNADGFLNVIRNALVTTSTDRHKAQPAGPAGDAVSRLVEHIGRTLNGDRDLKTLGAWAENIGVSLTMLRQACYLAHVPPHQARDFVRALVAVIRSKGLSCDVDLLLDFADTRTLRAFLARAGLTGRTAHPTVEDFLTRQQFIPARHEVLRLLRQNLLAQ